LCGLRQRKKLKARITRRHDELKPYSTNIDLWN
jgi:hypothetical protein